MNLYITTGTYEFLIKILNKYKDEQMLLMQNAQNSLIIHETMKKSVFGSPRTYEVINGKGNFPEEGYSVFYNIPISDEGKPVFEYHLQNNSQLIQTASGIRAFRFLKPKKGDTYIILTIWEDEKDFSRWKLTASYKTIINTPTVSAPLSSNTIFNGSPYESYYTIPNEEKK